MKTKLYLILLCLSLFSCGQNKTNPAMNNNEITSQNFVDKVLEKVKHYDKEPSYILRIGNNVNYEVYVNDIPVEKQYSNLQIATPIEINQAILRSGKQTVSFKIFPDKGKPFNGDSGIDIEVLVRDKRAPEDMSLDEKEKHIVEKEFLVGKDVASATKAGVYEGSFTLDAEVPYRLEGWSKGQDLTKLNQDSLQAAVVAFYRRMWKAIADKGKKDERLSLIFHRTVEMAIADYSDKKKIEGVLEDFLLPYTNKTYEMLPLKDYKMVMYCGGKCVALEQSTLDLPYRGYSALGATFKTEGGTKLGDMSQLILYLPEGKALKDGLEVIR